MLREGSWSQEPALLSRLPACHSLRAFCSLTILRSVRAPPEQPHPRDSPGRASQPHTSPSHGAAASLGPSSVSAELEGPTCCWCKSPTSSHFSLNLAELCPGTGSAKDKMDRSCESINRQGWQGAFSSTLQGSAARK